MLLVFKLGATGLLFVDCGLLKPQSWQIAESPISGQLRLRVERSGWGLCSLVPGSGLRGSIALPLGHGPLVT